MKRIICVLLSVCLLLSLGACHKDTNVPQTEAPTESQAPAESAPAAEQPEPETQPATETTEATEPPVEKIVPLSLEKTLNTYYEWPEDVGPTLVKSEHSYVTLSEQAAQQYPLMAEALNQRATMQENAMLDEFDNLVSFARDEYATDPDSFETLVSTLDVQVRRADSQVISLLHDSYAHHGQIEHYRVFHGTNYDPQTGELIPLNAVVDVNNNLAIAVETELINITLTGEFHYEHIVQDYFANTAYHDFSWTLDYNGITFYFAPGELCDGGTMVATVSFAQYPELFTGRYMSVPEEYTVEMAKDISFFVQLYGDPAPEAISFSAFRNDRDFYEDYGLYSNSNGQYFYEECYFYDFHPYYVKTAGGHYVYLLCEDFQEGMRTMELIVLSLNEDGSISKCGAKDTGPAFTLDNRYLVPTDPADLLLADFMSNLPLD